MVKTDMYNLFFSLVLTLIFSHNLCGQTYHSKIFDEKNGLPTNVIYNISQDSNGNIYAISNAGIFKFNGLSYEFINDLPEVNFTETTQILSSKSNMLFVTSQSKQKHTIRYNASEKWYKFKIDTLDFNEISPAIGFIGKTEFLAIPVKQKILLYEISEKQIIIDKPIEVKTSFDFTHICFTNDRLFILNNHQIHTFDGFILTKTFENNNEIIRKITHLAQNNTIYAIGDDWFGTIENNSVKKIYIKPSSKLVYKNKNTQITTDNFGRIFFNLHGFSHIYVPEINDVSSIIIKNLASGLIEKIFIDQENNYWAVTNRGLGLISSFRFKNFFFYNNNYLNEATTIIEHEDYLLVGGNNNVKFIRNDSLVHEYYLTDKDNYYGDEVRISSFVKTNNNEVFFTAIRGGYGFIGKNKKVESFIRVDSTFYYTAIYFKNNIYVLENNTVFEIHKGQILNKFNIKGYGRRFAILNDKLYLLGFGITEINQGKANVIFNSNPDLSFYNAIEYNNKIYLATNKGLAEFSNNTVVPLQNDFYTIKSAVYSLLVDSKNNFWVGTQNGIYCFNDKKVHFDVSNGLSGSELNRSALYEDKEGNIWIGTETGLSKFVTSNNFVHTQSPKIYIGNVTIDDVVYQSSDFPKAIDYEKNSIVFSIIAPNFSTDNNITFRVKLDENSQWFSATQAELSHLRFIDLKEGEYQLIIEAKNLSNNTYTIIKSEKFKILPPFYRTNFFRFLIVLLCFGVGYALLQFINQQRITKALSQKIQKKVKAFEAQEKLFKDVWNVTSEGLIITNLNGKIINANPSFLKGIKSTLEFVVGKEFHTIFKENDTLKSIDSFYRNLVNPENQNKTYEFEINLHGKTKVFETTFNFLDKIDENEETKIVVSLNDISKRKKNEQEIIDSRNKAEIAAKSRSAFLSNMSHEIRTPMNAIIGMTEILIADETDQEKLENLRAIKYSADNLLVIINDILDLSKIESGKFNINPQPFSLQKITHETIRLLKIKAKRNNVTIDYNIDPEVPNNLIGDASRLNQVLLNLIDNAIKFSPNGNVSVTIKNLSFNLNSCDLEFRIKDNGIGIPTDQKDIIFENFTQVNNSLTKSIIGTGLGLAITKKLINLQNGNISVESQPGLGSEFIFNLPFKINKTDFTHEKVEQIQEKTIKELQSKNILIVEDNLVNQLVVKKLLERYNIKTTIVNNGKECLEVLVNNHHFDVILMDIQMPIMDGITATKIIRANQNNVFKNANIPIIALTADVFEETRNAINESGFNEYMSKPVKESELIEKIANLVL